MTEVQLQEFKLDPDSELRFEVESKNEKVVLEVMFLETVKFKRVNRQYVAGFQHIYRYLSMRSGF